MKKSERIASVVLFLFSLALMFESRKLEYTAEYGRPGAGFFPFWLGIGIAILSIALFIQSQPKSGQKDTPHPFAEADRFKKPLMVIASMFIAVFLFQPLGFLLTIALWIASLLAIVERYDWKASLATAVAGSLGFYLVFEIWLNVPLPIGFLGI